MRDSPTLPTLTTEASPWHGKTLAQPCAASTPTSAREPSRLHDFVRITSSKGNGSPCMAEMDKRWLSYHYAAVACRLCGEHTRRHAALCKDCGLISHNRCREFAPSCKARTTVLFSRAPSISIPQPGESSFSLLDWNPFSRNRRSRQSSHRSSTDSSTMATGSATRSPTRPCIDSSQANVPVPGGSPLGSLGKADSPFSPHSASPAVSMTDHAGRKVNNADHYSSTTPGTGALRGPSVRFVHTGGKECPSPPRPEAHDWRPAFPPMPSRPFRHPRSQSQPAVTVSGSLSTAARKQSDCQAM